MIAAMALPGDRTPDAPILSDVLHHAADGAVDREALARIIDAIARASIPLARRLALGTLPGNPAAHVGSNDSGDRQKALDVAAHDHLIAALRTVSVQNVVSEEAADVIALSADGLYDVAIDPIDGSGSIGIGAPLGLLFAVYPAGSTLLRRGREMVAAGYVSFGHSVDLGWSTGTGVHMATLDAGDTFRVTDHDVTIYRDTQMIAYNASNQRHWGAGLQGYVADLLAGADGPRGQDFNMRWIAAAVGDLHRILRQGGVFLYPADRRKGYERGRLRLLYEAFPIAFLIEQAGGMASDGKAPILDLVPKTLHQHTPLFFGSASEMQTLLTAMTIQGDL